MPKKKLNTYHVEDTVINQLHRQTIHNDTGGCFLTCEEKDINMNESLNRQMNKPTAKTLANRKKSQKNGWSKEIDRLRRRI